MSSAASSTVNRMEIYKYGRVTGNVLPNIRKRYAKYCTFTESKPSIQSHGKHIRISPSPPNPRGVEHSFTRILPNPPPDTTLAYRSVSLLSKYPCLLSKTACSSSNPRCNGSPARVDRYPQLLCPLCRDRSIDTKGKKVVLNTLQMMKISCPTSGAQSSWLERPCS